MPNYIKKIYAGDVYEVEEYYSSRRAGERYRRGKNQNVTPEQQKEINLLGARKKLARLINANFRQGDLFVTLTHADEINYADAREELAKFLRRIRDYRKRKGMTELKYIAVTECGKSGREHHHIIMSSHDIEHVMRCWANGRKMVSKLEPGGEYTGLANYVTKEPVEAQKKRWSQSRNLDKPKIIRREITQSARRKPLRAPKGYIVIQESTYFSIDTGEVRYLRAVRKGGCDYAYGHEREEVQKE